MRTNQDSFVDRKFEGVQQVGEDPKLTIDEIQGLYNRPGLSLSRIRGTLMATTGIGLGAIWTLQQLRFRDRTLMVVREGGNITGWSGDIGCQDMFYDQPQYNQEDPPNGDARYSGISHYWARDWPEFDFEFPHWFFPWSFQLQKQDVPENGGGYIWIKSSR